jgi:tetratricopeptide (TPR) repeat protein
MEKAGDAAVKLFRIGITAAILFSPASCRRLPDIPVVNDASMHPAVRRQVEEARSLAAQRPADAQRAGRLGMILHSYELVEPAEACYQRAAALDAKQARWPYYLGLIRQQQKRHQEAAVFLYRAAELAPTLTAVHLRLADSLIATGAYAECRAVLSRLLVARAHTEQIYYRLGWLLETEGKREEAAQEYLKALDAFPNYKQAHLGLARVFRLVGQTADSERHTVASERIDAMQPVLEDSLANEMLALNLSPQGRSKRAVAYAGAGRLGDAIEEFQAVLRMEPENFNAHANLISLYARSGRWKEAADHYQSAAGLKPAEPVIHFDYANVLAAQGHLREAAAAAERSIKADPNFVRAHRLLAELLVVLGDPKRAEAEYRAALSIQPNEPLARRGIGLLLARARRDREALPHLQEARNCPDPLRIPVLKELSQVLLRLGDRSGGLSMLRELEQILLLHGSDEDREWTQRRIRSLHGGGKD